MAEIQWGNVAEWATAVVAGVALAATFLTVRHELSARRRVAAWVETARNQTWQVNVLNGSTTPIYTCTVIVGDPVPGSTAADERVYFGTVPPGTTLPRRFRWNGGPVPDDLLAPSLVVTIEYDDARGQRWRIYPGGKRTMIEALQSTC